MSFLTTKGLELRGFTMESGIFCIVIIHPVHGQRTIFLDKAINFGEIFSYLSTYFTENLDFDLDFVW